MDLQWQIKIIEQMIREDPEATIKDYLRLLDELRKIETATFTGRYYAIENDLNR